MPELTHEYPTGVCRNRVLVCQLTSSQYCLLTHFVWRLSWQAASYA